MRRFRNIFMCALSACTVYGCAIERDGKPNEDAIDEFQAWIDTYHPDAVKTALGVYILPDEVCKKEGESDAASIEDSDYIKVNCIARDLKGQVSSANTRYMAKRLGDYTSGKDSVNYYGPVIWNMKNNSISVGVKELIAGMKEGETKTGAIPSWLFTTATYATEAEYRKNVTGNSHAIYEITVENIMGKAGEPHKDAMNAWQIEEIEAFIDRHEQKGYDKPMPGFEDRKFPPAMKDTLKTASNTVAYMGSTYGFYFDNGAPLIKEEGAEKSDSLAFPTDTTVMINYTGRRLLPKYDDNGSIATDGVTGTPLYDEQIFDTTIENLAKDAGIYDPSRSYSPVKVKWSDKAAGITLGGNTVIPGFYNALWNMQYKHRLWEPAGKYEGKTAMPEARKSVAIFYSPSGYGVNGNGKLIPGYAPLMFEIEIIKETEKE